jgi:hypothetical protein
MLHQHLFFAGERSRKSQPQASPLHCRILEYGPATSKSAALKRIGPRKQSASRLDVFQRHSTVPFLQFNTRLRATEASLEFSGARVLVEGKEPEAIKRKT